jgi:hypothetical protein
VNYFELRAFSIRRSGISHDETKKNLANFVARFADWVATIKRA